MRASTAFVVLEAMGHESQEFTERDPSQPADVDGGQLTCSEQLVQRSPTHAQESRGFAQADQPQLNFSGVSGAARPVVGSDASEPS
jgi:hypothetical protein